jgi:hypothetical protein
MYGFLVLPLPFCCVQALCIVCMVCSHGVSAEWVANLCFEVCEKQLRLNIYFVCRTWLYAKRITSSLIPVCSSRFVGIDLDLVGLRWSVATHLCSGGQLVCAVQFTGYPTMNHTYRLETFLHSRHHHIHVMNTHAP